MPKKKKKKKKKKMMMEKWITKHLWNIIEATKHIKWFGYKFRTRFGYNDFWKQPLWGVKKNKVILSVSIICFQFRKNKTTIDFLFSNFFFLIALQERRLFKQGNGRVLKNDQLVRNCTLQYLYRKYLQSPPSPTIKLFFIKINKTHKYHFKIGCFGSSKN